MSESEVEISYAEAIREAFAYLLTERSDVFVIGQGLWSPWYVGDTMTHLEQQFGASRIIDTPVSELACTGAAVGAALAGYRPIVTHPRVDFALLATDQVVNQAAKWSSMFGGASRVPVTFRLIINRGGEQGAQHSQSLHSWFAHIPGLRVVMPFGVSDARDLLIASVMSNDPVVYIDDRWLYDVTAQVTPMEELDLATEGPRLVREGVDLTLVGAGYSVKLCVDAAERLSGHVDCEVIDVRVLNPLQIDPVLQSVRKTQRLCVVDGDWRTCGLAGEIIAAVVEREIIPWLSRPIRITLPDAPAPTSRPLEDSYYSNASDIALRVRRLVEDER